MQLRPSLSYVGTTPVTQSQLRSICRLTDQNCECLKLCHESKTASIFSLLESTSPSSYEGDPTYYIFPCATSESGGQSVWDSIASSRSLLDETRHRPNSVFKGKIALEKTELLAEVLIQSVNFQKQLRVSRDDSHCKASESFHCKDLVPSVFVYKISSRFLFPGMRVGGSLVAGCDSQ